MKFEEIQNLLQYNDYKGYESSLFMPNEIFQDLKANIKNTPHIAFAYSYTYLVTWLYRYTKFLVGKDAISNNKIKEILGYKPETRTVNYLIKKNGLLDQIGYLTTENDFPVWWNQSQFEALEFTMYSEEKEFFTQHNVPRNYTAKYPVKAFERIIKTKDGELELEGTFYNVENTHMIPFEVFLYCMSNEDIGCTGFYLYAYLKHKNDLYGGYDVSLENLSSDTGIADRTLDKYLGMLKGYKLVDFIINQKFFAIGLKEEDRMANTYIANEYSEFKDKPVPFEKINIMKKKDYFNMLKKEEEEKRKVWGEPLVDIPLDELPY